MRKKIIPITLSVAMMINTAVLPASAAQKPVANPGFSVISSTTQKDGEVVFYSFNVPSNSMAKVTIEYTSAEKKITYYCKDFYNHPQPYMLGKQLFKTMIGIQTPGSGVSGSAPDLDLRHSGGKYELVKFKLSDFDDYFSEDGTCKVTYFGKTYVHDFTDHTTAEGDIYSSCLFIYSDGAINHVVPDKNGEVQAYLSTKIGEPARFTTNFHYSIRSDGHFGGGGGCSGRILRGLTIGDCDLSGYMDISDVTTLQMYAASQLSFNKLQVRNGDIDRNKTIDITDATMLQQALAKK